MFSVVLGAAVAFLVTVLLGSKFIEFLQSRVRAVRARGGAADAPHQGGHPDDGWDRDADGALRGARGRGAAEHRHAYDALARGRGRRHRPLRRLAEDLQKRPKAERRYKFLLTLAVVLADVLAVRYVGVTQTVLVPYFDQSLVLGLGSGIALFSVFLLLVIAGTTNAVNLTDGLDGLAAGLGYSAAGLHGHRFPGAPVRRGGDLRRDGGGDRRVPLVQLPPGPDLYGRHGLARDRRRVRRGAVLTKTELLLPIVGGLFVVEAVSVMVQVFVYKLTGRRVFKMAPIHHHFEFLGWDENKVVVRFWIAQAAFSSVGFFLYYIFLYNAAG